MPVRAQRELMEVIIAREIRVRVPVCDARVVWGRDIARQRLSEVLISRRHGRSKFHKLSGLRVALVDPPIGIELEAQVLSRFPIEKQSAGREVAHSKRGAAGFACLPRIALLRSYGHTPRHGIPAR